MTDYELEYQRNESACGEPFPEVVAFFEGLGDRTASVLDLGCGQGRDALMIGRLGHRVRGVDSAPTGVAQMQARAEAEQLEVRGEIADLRRYEPSDTNDVVVLDRVVHMFPDDRDKEQVLALAVDSVAERGYVVVVETPSNLPYVERCFEPERGWEVVLRRKGFRFYRRIEPAS